MNNETDIIVAEDELGRPITQEQIDIMLNDIENEKYSKFEDASSCIYGRLNPISETSSTISFSLPDSMKEELEELAQKQNCSKSELIRAFVADGLLQAKASINTNIAKTNLQSRPQIQAKAS